MFTGLIEEVGRVESLQPRGEGARLHIGCAVVASDAREGDSICVGGVCLTALDVTKEGFSADVAPETMLRTSLGDLRAGALVNLERSLAAGARLGGHIVQGHVDGTGSLRSLTELGDGNWWLEIDLPDELERYVVFKGSIAIDGISLTVAAIEGNLLSVTILPHTWEHTALRDRAPGARVNLETDVLAKYVEKMLARLAVK